MKIRPAVSGDAAEISSLIRRLSHLFTLAPEGEGAERFLATISEEAIRGYIDAGNFFYLVAEEHGQLAGAVAIRDWRHLYHLFVAPEFRGRGLGRLLWARVCDAACEAGNAGEFTVNSSPDAVPVYERFGFSATGPRVEQHGIAFVPMKLTSI